LDGAFLIEKRDIYEIKSRYMKKKNILHIITHDTGRHLGYFGEDVRTTNIDQLAKNGVIFTNYFCSAPQCSPSRASMFSSLMPHNNGVYGLAHRGFILNEKVEYLPKILNKNGYSTLLFGIQHETDNPHKLGYQKIFTNYISCEQITPLLLNFLQEKPPQPFFVSVGFVETHQPFPIIEKPPDTLKVPSFLPDEIEVKKDIAGLNILIEKVDRSIGEIIKILQKTKLIENTIVVFTTDHGIAFPGAKATLFDPGIGIFLIMSGADIPSDKKFNCLSSNLDFMPTILDYLSIKKPEKIAGISLMPIIKGEKGEIREEIFAELTYHAAYDPIRCIRTNKYKYIRSFEARPYYFPPNVDNCFSKGLFRRKGYYKRIRPFEFFFDIEKDPLERKNLINRKDYKEIIDKFRNQLKKWMEETGDPLLKGMVSPPKNAKITPPWAYDPETLW